MDKNTEMDEAMNAYGITGHNLGWTDLDPQPVPQEIAGPDAFDSAQPPVVAFYKDALSSKHDQVEALQVELRVWKRCHKDLYKRNVILSKQLRNSNWIAMCAWLTVVGMLVALWTTW